jgi:ribosomal-protein-alanine N-acetyltransferase
MRALDKEVEDDDDINQLLTHMPPKNELNNNLWWLIYNSNNVLVGNFGIKIDLKNHRGEIGYVLFKRFWGQKIMSSTLPSLLNFCFQNLNLHSLEARVSPQNVVSKKLLLKLGFVKEGHIKEDYYYNGGFIDTEVFSLLRSNYVPRETINNKNETN